MKTASIKTGIYAAAALTWLLMGRKPNGQLNIFMNGNDGWSNTIIFFALLFLFSLTGRLRKDREKSVVFKALALLVAAGVSLCGIAGKIYKRTRIIGLVSTIRGAKLNLLLFPLGLIGGIILIYELICALESLLALLTRNEKRNSFTESLARVFLGKHALLWQLGFLLLIWIPQVLIRYPGVAMFDALYSLSQYYEMNPYTSKHPTAFALIFGFFTDLGKRLGSGNLGLFLMVLMQTVLLIFAILYTIHIMKQLQIPDVICLAAYFILVFAPSTITTATVVMKDSIFCIAFLVLTDELAWFLFSPERDGIRASHLILLFLSGLGLFMRHDGIYILAFFLAVLIAAELVLALRAGKRNGKDGGGKGRRQLTAGVLAFLLTLLVAFGSGELLTKYLNRRYEVQAMSTRVILSLPLQQVSRYVSVYGYEMTEEERNTLKKVMDLPVEEFRQKYDPLNFEWIKWFFAKDAAGEDGRDFLKLWLTFLKKHPAVCVDATINQNYLLFSPLINKENYFTRLSSYLITSNSEYTYDFNNLFHDVGRLYGWQERLLKYYNDFGSVPLIGLITNTGLHTILLLAVMLYALVRRQGRLLLLLCPPLMILAFTFLGPAISGNLRYVFPIMWTMPVWTGIFCLEMKGGARS